MTISASIGGAPNFQNRTLYHGDNLDFLRGINSETVHLIATDPPFNKNRDFHATPDSLAAGARFKDRWRWDEDVHEEWADSIIDDWPAVWEVITAARAAYGDDMGAFLCWLGVRLMEMRRVLRADGSIYLHIDHTAHAYVKCLMDAIFGWKNFRNEIVWCYSGGGIPKKDFPRKHDSILRYSKAGNYVFNGDAVRVPYDSDYNATVFAGPNTRAPGKTYGPDPRGKIVEDWWRNIPRPYGKNRSGFPTEKPLALYERIIKASSNKGDFVLDPFCGCATTPIAAERLNRQWIGIDIWDGAQQQVRQRLERDTVLRYGEQGHVTLPQVHIKTQPPVRTDENEVAAQKLNLKIQRAQAPWQRITHRGMTNILAAAQASSGGVICAGCGRVLEREFMQLDHITPKSDRGENHIMNRILLCGPCNRRKRDNLTLRGLLRENKKKTIGWMKDEGRAKLAQEAARERAEWVRDNFASAACQVLIAGE